CALDYPSLVSYFQFLIRAETNAILLYYVIPKRFLVTLSSTLKAFHLYGGSNGKSPVEKPKTLRPFFFLRLKRNKKTCPLPPQQMGFAFVQPFKNNQGASSIF